MRNELDEESRFILQKLKQTLNDLLMYLLKSKYPMKTNNDLKEIYNQKLTGFLLEEEWKRMISQIYESEDVANLENKIYDFIRKKDPIQNKADPSEK